MNRYDLEHDESGGYMARAPEGEWVRYEDIKHLLVAPEVTAITIRPEDVSLYAGMLVVTNTTIRKALLEPQSNEEPT